MNQEKEKWLRILRDSKDSVGCYGIYSTLVAHDGLWMSTYGLRLTPNDVLWMYFGHLYYRSMPSLEVIRGTIFGTSMDHPQDALWISYFDTHANSSVLNTRPQTDSNNIFENQQIAQCCDLCVLWALIIMFGDEGKKMKKMKNKNEIK